MTAKSIASEAAFGAEIEVVIPKWATTWGALAASKALVRSQCRRCGVQLRVDARVQSLRFGAIGVTKNMTDRCTMVGCHGSVFYLAARTYGRQWIALVTSEALRSAIADAAPAVNAVSLDLVGGEANRRA